ICHLQSFLLLLLFVLLPFLGIVVLSFDPHSFSHLLICPPSLGGGWVCLYINMNNIICQPYFIYLFYIINCILIFNQKQKPLLQCKILVVVVLMQIRIYYTGNLIVFCCYSLELLPIHRYR